MLRILSYMPNQRTYIISALLRDTEVTVMAAAAAAPPPRRLACITLKPDEGEADRAARRSSLMHFQGTSQRDNTSGIHGDVSLGCLCSSAMSIWFS
ncbi:hypothetical protein P4O66_005311 [Electrophorus voltai]|uniref:Uncharacterized protein n=1 Tax=Electrophorus voltai TaxID=2609070 RepID=A0AAD9E738_9TELE|nr:hypothetical protein P4O66_005311 [Electrophorus voltai]